MFWHLLFGVMVSALAFGSPVSAAPAAPTPAQQQAAERLARFEQTFKDGRSMDEIDLGEPAVIFHELGLPDFAEACAHAALDVALRQGGAEGFARAANTLRRIHPAIVESFIRTKLNPSQQLALELVTDPNPAVDAATRKNLLEGWGWMPWSVTARKQLGRHYDLAVARSRAVAGVIGALADLQYVYRGWGAPGVDQLADFWSEAGVWLMEKHAPPRKENEPVYAIAAGFGSAWALMETASASAAAGRPAPEVRKQWDAAIAAGWRGDTAPPATPATVAAKPASAPAKPSAEEAALAREEAEKRRHNDPAYARLRPLSESRHRWLLRDWAKLENQAAGHAGTEGFFRNLGELAKLFKQKAPPDLAATVVAVADDFTRQYAGARGTATYLLYRGTEDAKVLLLSLPKEKETLVREVFKFTAAMKTPPADWHGDRAWPARNRGERGPKQVDDFSMEIARRRLLDGHRGAAQDIYTMYRFGNGAPRDHWLMMFWAKVALGLLPATDTKDAEKANAVAAAAGSGDAALFIASRHKMEGKKGPDTYDEEGWKWQRVAAEAGVFTSAVLVATRDSALAGGKGEIADVARHVGIPPDRLEEMFKASKKAAGVTPSAPAVASAPVTAQPAPAQPASPAKKTGYTPLDLDKTPWAGIERWRDESLRLMEAYPAANTPLAPTRQAELRAWWSRAAEGQVAAEEMERVLPAHLAQSLLPGGPAADPAALAQMRRAVARFHGKPGLAATEKMIEEVETLAFGALTNARRYQWREIGDVLYRIAADRQWWRPFCPEMKPVTTTRTLTGWAYARQLKESAAMIREYCPPAAMNVPDMDRLAMNAWVKFLNQHHEKLRGWRHGEALMRAVSARNHPEAVHYFNLLALALRAERWAAGEDAVAKGFQGALTSMLQR